MPISVNQYNPTVQPSTSTQLLPANTQRRYLAVLNTTGANIMVNLQGETLTGITPTSTNKGIVVGNNSFFQTQLMQPSPAITCYHAGASATNAIAILEGV